MSKIQIQSGPTDHERGGYIQVATGIFAINTPCLREFTAFKGDSHEPHEQPQSASNLLRWPQLGDSNFGDTHFRESSVDIHTNTHTNYNILGWSFLCCGRHITFPVNPGSRAQDTSAFYLGNIYHDPNTTITSILSPVAVAQPLTFSPPTYAVWVDFLSFMSLVITDQSYLRRTLLATSLQQWARRYATVASVSAVDL